MKRTHRRGFTLVELLVVIAIIAILMGIILPVLSSARFHANKIKCQSNLHQLMLGMNMYTWETKGGWYVTTADYTNDSLESVIPKYVKDGHVAICPGTKNVVDLNVTQLETVGGVTRSFYPHLRTISQHAEIETGGHSYEVFCWAGVAEYPDGVKITAATTYMLTAKNVRKPSETWILLDRDQAYGGSINNWPDKGDNHGDKGTNLAFCDGHVEFVDRAGMVRAMLTSRHPWPRTSGDLAPALALVPGLKNTGGWAGKWWY